MRAAATQKGDEGEGATCRQRTADRDEHDPQNRERLLDPGLMGGLLTRATPLRSTMRFRVIIVNGMRSLIGVVTGATRQRTSAADRTAGSANVTTDHRCAHRQPVRAVTVLGTTAPSPDVSGELQPQAAVTLRRSSGLVNLT